MVVLTNPGGEESRKRCYMVDEPRRKIIYTAGIRAARLLDSKFGAVSYSRAPVGGLGRRPAYGRPV